MVRRRIAPQPTSRLALWARRIALFSLAATFIAVVVVRSGALDIVPALSRHVPPAFIVDKPAYSAFSGSRLRELLVEKHVGSVVITGAGRGMWTASCRICSRRAGCSSARG